MTKSLSALLVFGLTLLLSLPALAQPVSSKAPPLSPEESVKTMVVQDGYKVIPVLTEPQIHEPSAIAWDGNGRLYVVEMRTYMQEIDGKDQLKSTSRVSRHEDTNGDGVYDKHSVFADNLSLPRMVLREQVASLHAHSGILPESYKILPDVFVMLKDKARTLQMETHHLKVDARALPDDPKVLGEWYRTTLAE